MKKLIFLILIFLIIPLISSTCIDSDSGNLPYKKGASEGTIGSSIPLFEADYFYTEDHCIWGKAIVSECSGEDCYLNEYYCENGNLEQVRIVCDDACVAGVCTVIEVSSDPIIVEESNLDQIIRIGVIAIIILLTLIIIIYLVSFFSS